MYLPTTLAPLAAAAPRSFTVYDNYSTAGIEARSQSSSSCSTNGALVCSDNGKSYALCNWGHATFQPVSAGTLCVCHHESGACTIASAEGSMPETQPGPTPSPAPPVITTSTSAPAAPTSAPAPSLSAPASPSGSAGGSSWQYKQFNGNGSPSQGWPTIEQWLSFDDLWTMNLKSVISAGGEGLGVPNNTPQQSEDIKKALLSVSKQAGVDPRYSLATMLQESLGAVFVQSTNYGVENNGIFQSHDGNGTCSGQTSCSDAEIVQMCRDGIEGTQSGPGLEQLLKQANDGHCDGKAMIAYRASRMYNSGSIAAGGNLGGGIATHCYCSDIANRLMGWHTGPTGCTLDA